MNFDFPQMYFHYVENIWQIDGIWQSLNSAKYNLVSIGESFTVVAIEVLIKYCINSFPKLTNSFERKLINFLQNCSASLLFVCDWSVLAEVKSN